MSINELMGWMTDEWATPSQIADRMGVRRNAIFPCLYGAFAARLLVRRERTPGSAHYEYRRA